MDDFIHWLSVLGGLHDVTVRSLSWDSVLKELRLELTDIYIDLEDRPEYPGEVSGSLIFSDVVEVSMSFECLREMWIHECICSTNQSPTVEITFIDGGSITVQFNSISFPKLLIP